MIPADFQASYAATKKQLEVLRSVVENILDAIARDRGGLVVMRIKEEVSAYEKSLLGIVREPLSQMSDLLGATLVLKKPAIGKDREALEEALRNDFVIERILSARNENPSLFIYDDLHYILKLKDSPALLNKDLLKLRFELQVKTYLQHGWSICTHGLNYKPAKESWRAHRVVSETKALVEVADNVLLRGEDFLDAAEDRPNDQIDSRVQIAQKIEGWWKRGGLPVNKRRLGEFVVRFLRLAKIPVDDFLTLLDSGRARELADKLSLSVHEAVLILIIEANRMELVGGLRARNTFLMVTQSMEDISPSCKEIPPDMRIQTSVVP